jgi:hypothetical protein
MHPVSIPTGTLQQAAISDPSAATTIHLHNGCAGFVSLKLDPVPDDSDADFLGAVDVEAPAWLSLRLFSVSGDPARCWPDRSPDVPTCYDWFVVSNARDTR